MSSPPPCLHPHHVPDTRPPVPCVPLCAACTVQQQQHEFDLSPYTRGRGAATTTSTPDLTPLTAPPTAGTAARPSPSQFALLGSPVIPGCKTVVKVRLMLGRACKHVHVCVCACVHV
eukprot:347142-Chlamydomonas_euryale.AAC.1